MFFCYDIGKGVKRMRREENWAVEIGRIRAFFREQEDACEKDGGFICGNCRITLIQKEENAMGKWLLPRTLVIFEGEDDAVLSIHRRFFLRFLSAGG